MDILEVIRRHGHTTYTLAKEMGIKQSSLSNILNGNPTVKTLRQMAEKIPCSIAEFFLDELPEDFDLAAVRKPKDDASDLPFDNQQPATTPGVFVCPNCGAGVSFGAFVVSKPAKEEKHDED